MDTVDLKSTLSSLAEGIYGGRSRVRVCCDSRVVQAGDVFVAVRGVQVDGHDYVAQAIERGAQVVVAERAVEVLAGVELVRVDDSAEALGALAQAEAGRPAEQLVTLGVTGTNGKTTVAYLVRAIMDKAGRRCGLLGTVEYDLGGREPLAADNTTPDAIRIAEMMRQMRDNGLAAMVMECSSHGLDQGRTAGIRFDAAAFTNLSGDHLDYHGTPEAYLAAKQKLFEGLDGEAVAVLNADDPASEQLAQATRAKVWRYGLQAGVEITGRVKAMGLWGSEIELAVRGETVLVRCGLVGMHNVSNCLAAAGLARAGGAVTATIVEAVEEFSGVPGRLERVDAGQDFAVLVDYAHTDDALQHALKTVRDLTEGRVIVVFGCGGERDRSKRPRMARVAEKWADVVVMTNDNPRREDADRIRAEIRAGFTPAGLQAVREVPDRREAIARAANEARAGDAVLIAGKGHEDYQLVGQERLHFDDRQVVREELEKR